MSNEPPIADNEAIYDEQISPLMAEILRICQTHKIPMLASFQYAPDDFCTSFILPKGCDECLVRASEVIKPSFLAFTVTRAEPTDGSTPS